MSTPGTRFYISRSEEGKSLRASHNPALRVTAGMELYPWRRASPVEPGPHHESAAGVGELPVGAGLAERTHPELLFALTDLLPAGKGRSMQQGSAQTLTVSPLGRWGHLRRYVTEHQEDACDEHHSPRHGSG